MISKNAEGYADPTAGEAIMNVDYEEKRYRKLLKLIFSICELAGYYVEISSVKDKRTGKIWR